MHLRTCGIVLGRLTWAAVATGQAYLLGPVGPGVFRHVDDAGRIVEFTLTGQDRASLLVTGSGGDGRVTWQLSRVR